MAVQQTKAALTLINTQECGVHAQPGALRAAVAAALRGADCLLASYEHAAAPGFPFGDVYCLVDFARCPLNAPSAAAAAALESAPCPRSALKAVWELVP
jgi:hypothetical protein